MFGQAEIHFDFLSKCGRTTTRRTGFSSRWWPGADRIVVGGSNTEIGGIGAKVDGGELLEQQGDRQRDVIGVQFGGETLLLGAEHRCPDDVHAEPPELVLHLGEPALPGAQLVDGHHDADVLFEHVPVTGDGGGEELVCPAVTRATACPGRTVPPHHAGNLRPARPAGLPYRRSSGRRPPRTFPPPR